MSIGIGTLLADFILDPYSILAKLVEKIIDNLQINIIKNDSIEPTLTQETDKNNYNLLTDWKFYAITLVLVISTYYLLPIIF